jgi:hypothetical protein
MSAVVVEEASVMLPIFSGKPDADGMIASAEIAGVLRSPIAALGASGRARLGWTGREAYPTER